MAGTRSRPRSRASDAPAKTSPLRPSIAVVFITMIAGGGMIAWRTWRQMDARVAALTLAEGNHPAEALSALEAILARDPHDVEVLSAIISARIRSSGLAIDQEPLLDRLCALTPNDPTPLRIRSELRGRIGRKADALADALTVVELEPNDHATRRRAAWLAVDLGEREMAERELAHLLAHSPYPKTELGTRLALARWQAGDAAGAREVLDHYAPPGTSAGAVLRGVLEYEAGRFPEAIAILESAEPADDGERQFALNYLGLALARLGRAVESKATFDRLSTVYRAVRAAEDAAQRPDDLSAQLAAARANLAANKAIEAARIAEAAVTRHGDDVEALTIIAEAYEKLRRPDMATIAKQRAAKASSKRR
jgi:tetratricopeptide (TPR) repeat protein